MMMFERQCQVSSVQIGRAEPLQIGDRTVLSGIGKRAVTGSIAVNKLGLEGDEQADLTVHGGLSKAVYAYPAEHYRFWREQRSALGLSTELLYGTLGENLTLTRQPCDKFNAVMGDAKAAKKMVQSGFCGFYLAVESPGHISAGQAFVLEPGPRQLPIMALFKKVKK